MKVGDVIKFKETGVIGTITDTSRTPLVAVLAHGAEMPPDPTCFRAGYLKEVAEIISAS